MVKTELVILNKSELSNKHSSLDYAIVDALHKHQWFITVDYIFNIKVFKNTIHVFIILADY